MKKKNKSGYLIAIAYLEAQKNEIKHQVAALEQDEAQLSAKTLALKKEEDRIREKVHNLRNAAQDCRATNRRLLAKRWSQDAILEEQRCSKIEETIKGIESLRKNIEQKICGRENEDFRIENEIRRTRRKAEGWLRPICQKTQIFCKDFLEKLYISFQGKDNF